MARLQQPRIRKDASQRASRAAERRYQLDRYELPAARGICSSGEDRRLGERAVAFPAERLLVVGRFPDEQRLGRPRLHVGQLAPSVESFTKRGLEEAAHELV